MSESKFFSCMNSKKRYILNLDAIAFVIEDNPEVGKEIGATVYFKDQHYPSIAIDPTDWTELKIMLEA